MLSKTQNKYIRSLTQQKFREEHNVFVAEGDKIAKEWLLSAASIQIIVAEEVWLQQNAYLVQKHPEAAVHTVSENELQALSSLQTPNQVLLVVAVPVKEVTLPVNGWCIALDNIQDPGNMGTIIRIADWFGVKHIICSPDCVDIYNPKVIQAGMGSHIRVNIHTAGFDDFILHTKMPLLAAALEGENVYKFPKISSGILLIGNESKGISPNLLQAATHKITIPRRGGAESLNAAVSTGILCALLIS